MFNGNKYSKRSKKSDINITPLVDVMLVLLVIFMVITPSIQSELDVKLPKIQYVRNVAQVEKKDLLKISLSQDKIVINKKKISHAELGKVLKDYKKDMIVMLKADEKLSYKEVFQVIDLLKANGFYNVALVGTIE